MWQVVNEKNKANRSQWTVIDAHLCCVCDVSPSPFVADTSPASSAQSPTSSTRWTPSASGCWRPGPTSTSPTGASAVLKPHCRVLGPGANGVGGQRPTLLRLPMDMRNSWHDSLHDRCDLARDRHDSAVLTVCLHFRPRPLPVGKLPPGRLKGGGWDGLAASRGPLPKARRSTTASRCCQTAARWRCSGGPTP